MLHLPAELVISVLQYLSLSSLGSLSSTSREWQNFIQVNESILYRNAAVLHGFTASAVYSDLAEELPPRCLIGVTDWKSFCQTSVHFQKAWRGEAASYVTAHTVCRGTVHRIKVDERRGFSIVTSTTGGLIVADLYTDSILWSLSLSYVHRYAHCEYDAGYLVFDRTTGEKEVWRVVEDSGMIPDSPTFAFPDDMQHAAASLYPGDLSVTRGHFRPWAILRPPEVTRAFRFVYPTLIAASTDALFLWNVTTGELIQTIHDAQREDTLGMINYVEVSAQHAFVCGSDTLRIFSRASGRWVLDVPSSQRSYGRHSYFLVPGGLDRSQQSVLKRQSVDYLRISLPNNGRLVDEFTGVHVSACGKHFAALLASSRLIIVPFFQRVIDNNVDIWDIALDIQLGSPRSVARYLAFENGRVAVATDTGIYVVSVDFEAIEHDPTRVSVHRAVWFNSPIRLRAVSCLQMTMTGIYVTWGDAPAGRITLDGDLVINPEWEHIFENSLREERSISHTPDGDDAVALFELVAAGFALHTGLFSIDLLPTPLVQAPT
ncbi:hypothetical protein FB45DRAFT_949312 [Roridomyces roridus]|uniref:F-box domain-containing protein n=1 Tax=Roridomyces roridus TaxID=1738132 RepID=A0AAD7B1Q4_9AGAR|nr:hypothetical protein FB45DRAFT_949312 [Roridomyces roridus]